MSLIRCITAVVAICLIAGVIAFAEVPNLITYQGRLTDDTGTPVADGDYSIVFDIYNGTDFASQKLWTDTMTVTASEGLFSILLGSETPLLPEVFDGTTRYLAITIVGESEMTPRTPIVSVPYAMVAGSALSEAVDCHSCDTIFINSTGPETLTAVNADTALRILNSGDDAQCVLSANIEATNNTAEMYAVRGTCSDFGTNGYTATGGLFLASGGEGIRHGVYGQAGTTSQFYPAYGVRGHGFNNSADGDAYGGYFSAAGTDPSNHFGAYGYAKASNDATAIGVLGTGTNNNFGPATGGVFTTGSGGTGRHMGSRSLGQANNDSIATGVYGYASNYGAGRAYGGEFTAISNGTGRHFGVVAIAETDNDSSAYGVYGEAIRTSPGNAYGGYFTASGSVNINAIGVIGYISNPGPATGVYSYATSSGSSTIRGVQISCSSNGTGLARGVDGYVLGGPSSDDIYGIDMMADGGSNYTGTSYGGYFTATALTFAGNQYALYGLSESMSNTYAAFGMYGRSQHYGSGTSYGSYFLADSTGTGNGYGVRAVGLTKGNATAYGINSVAANKSTGAVYGGYFEALNYGTGTRYGVYGKAASAGYAGYFSGNARVTGNFTTVGTKSAAVKMDDGNYRLVYCQESPENWFEDFGEGRLTNGRAHIELDPLFLNTVTINQSNPMKVFIQLNDDCYGTYVKTSSTGFDVYELQKGTSDASFTYRVVAKRRGYEDIRLARMAGPTPEEAEAEAALASEQLQADRDAAEQDLMRHGEAKSRQATEQPVVPDEGLR